MNAMAALLLACTPLLHAPLAYDSIGAARIFAADLDVDGAPDVITSGPYGVGVLWGAHGVLGKPVVLATDSIAAFVTDVDGDGLPDIIATRTHAFDVRDTLILRNLGQRRFGAPEIIATEERGVIAVADFTSDGRPDIIIPRPGGNGLLLRNDGRGHFTAEETTRIDVDDAVTGDVDGDGKLDLVHARASQRLVIERGDGNGRFSGQLMTFWSPLTAALEDLDGDGRADLIALFESAGELIVYRSPLDFKATERVPAGGPHAMTSGDFNGDGELDLAVLSRRGTLLDSGARVLIFLGDGHGKLARSQDVLIGSATSESIATADFNRDGVLDLVIPAGESSVGLVFGRGDGTFETPPILQARRHTKLNDAIDLNGDGIDELIGYDLARFPIVGVQKDDGTYHFEWLPVAGLAHAAGDPNEHGWRTLLVAGEDLSVLSRSPDGVWSLVRTIPGLAYAVASEDLDGDGQREIIVVNEGRLRVLDANGNERFSAETGWRAHFRIFVADVNRDARPDLVVMRRGTESPVPHPPIFSDGFIALYLGRGDATFEPERRLVDEKLVGNVAVGDFNGDGNVDILAGIDDALLLRGDGRGGFTPRRAPAGFTHAGDLNGDGILDVLTWDRTLHQGTRGGFVRLNTYALAPSAFVLARRAPNARPTLVGILDRAGETSLVDVECGTTRGRAARH